MWKVTYPQDRGFKGAISHVSKSFMGFISKWINYGLKYDKGKAYYYYRSTKLTE